MFRPLSRWFASGSPSRTRSFSHAARSTTKAGAHLLACLLLLTLGASIVRGQSSGGSGGGSGGSEGSLPVAYDGDPGYPRLPG
ncbi:MAG: hypothetical protein JWN14_3755, partial [Chthonomonadales bacterium]|nr:hypothetical protein [Chthonomonadales bacterium]